MPDLTKVGNCKKFIKGQKVIILTRVTGNTLQVASRTLAVTRLFLNPCPQLLLCLPTEQWSKKKQEGCKQSSFYINWTVDTFSERNIKKIRMPLTALKWCFSEHTWVIPVSSLQKSLSFVCSWGCTYIWNSDSISPLFVFSSTAGNSTMHQKKKKLKVM